MDGCPFCAMAAGRTDADLVVIRTDQALVVPALKQRRRNRGHMLVLSVRHVTRLSEADAGMLQDLYGMAGRVSIAAREAFGATGVTMFQNEDAPDQVLPHLHVHVVPRIAGDDFRMPDSTGDQLAYAERLEQVVALRRTLR